MFWIKRFPGEEALCKCKVSSCYDWRILCVANHRRNVSEGSWWCQCNFWKQFPKRPGVCSGNSEAQLSIFEKNQSHFGWYWSNGRFKMFFQSSKLPFRVHLFFSHHAVIILLDESYLVYFWKYCTLWLDMPWHQSYQNVYGNWANCSPFEHGEPLWKLVWCTKSGEIIAFCFCSHCFYFCLFVYDFGFAFSQGISNVSENRKISWIF